MSTTHSLTSCAKLLHLSVESVLIAGRDSVLSLLSVADGMNQRGLGVRIQHGDPVGEIGPKLKAGLGIKVRWSSRINTSNVLDNYRKLKQQL